MRPCSIWWIVCRRRCGSPSSSAAVPMRLATAASDRLNRARCSATARPAADHRVAQACRDLPVRAYVGAYRTELFVRFDVVELSSPSQTRTTRSLPVTACTRFSHSSSRPVRKASGDGIRVLVILDPGELAVRCRGCPWRSGGYWTLESAIQAFDATAAAPSTPRATGCRPVTRPGLGCEAMPPSPGPPPQGGPMPRIPDPALRALFEHPDLSLAAKWSGL
jgi:hypothetical protein